MKTKLINDEGDKKQAVIIVAGVIGVLKLLGGEKPYMPRDFIESNAKIAQAFVDWAVEVESGD